jgi:hypothetical protein
MWPFGLLYLIVLFSSGAAPIIIGVSLYLFVKWKLLRNSWWKLGFLIGTILGFLVWVQGLRRWGLRWISITTPEWFWMGLFLYSLLFASVFLFAFAFLSFSRGKRDWRYILLGAFLVIIGIAYFLVIPYLSLGVGQ